MTSWLSLRSVTRRAMRRLVFDLISALTTPAGRCVASSRCTPSDRPRRAMSTSPVTKSGQLGDECRELVDHDHQSGHRRVVGAARGQVVLDVLRARARELVLAAAQLRGEALQRARGQVRVEVGDHADRVRQRAAVLERRAALVVDQDERHLVGPVARPRATR